MEHLWTDLYHSPPLEFAQDSSSVQSAQRFTKPTVYSLWATEILWKYCLAWTTEMEVQTQKKYTDKESKWKREDMEGWLEIKAFKRLFKSFRNSSSVQSHWKNSPLNCFRKYLSKLILKILITVFHLFILKKIVVSYTSTIGPCSTEQYFLQSDTEWTHSSPWLTMQILKVNC